MEEREIYIMIREYPFTNITSKELTEFNPERSIFAYMKSNDFMKYVGKTNLDDFSRRLIRANESVLRHGQRIECPSLTITDGYVMKVNAKLHGVAMKNVGFEKIPVILTFNDHKLYIEDDLPMLTLAKENWRERIGFMQQTRMHVPKVCRPITKQPSTDYVSPLMEPVMICDFRGQYRENLPTEFRIAHFNQHDTTIGL